MLEWSPLTAVDLASSVYYFFIYIIAIIANEQEYQFYRQVGQVWMLYNGQHEPEWGVLCILRAKLHTISLSYYS